MVSPGTLYIVSTPIGNLEDISVRALAVLAGVDLIAAEDTRTTGNLLKHFGIKKPMLSYFSYNEARRVPDLVSKLKEGRAIAVVSDAGTPGISDPAWRLISAAIDADIPIVAIPGPTAFLPALIVSGLPIGSFVFEGFLPVKKGRTARLQELAKEERTIVLYESPHRLLRTLADLKKAFGDRRISVAREITKKFEEVVRGTIPEVIEHFTKTRIRGEFVLVIAGRGGRDR
ncbi:MAG TPA: 16S rRNA (cytidine(1402)-2'-O)-methyltransferase [Bacteroidota bacterium]|nr:16S rRNA (cytidine(1402)-2'-O)-methyltransferase [Bacteroidota bacterium]